MPRAAPRLLLFLVPALLVGTAVALTLSRGLRLPDTQDGPKVEVDSATVGGVTFEFEYREGSERYQSAWGKETVGAIRGADVFDYRFGIPTVNGTAFPSPNPGDTVRWNRTGPLLINAQPVEPHRFQPKQLDAPPTELKWDILHPSDAPRDSLTADWSRVGRVLVTAHGDGVARVWDIDKKAVRTVITPNAPTDGRKRWGLKATVSPDGKTVATANVQAPAVSLWEAETGKHIATLTEPAGKVTDLRFASDAVLFEAHCGSLFFRDLSGDRSKTSKWSAVHNELLASFAYATASGILATNDGKSVVLHRHVVPPDLHFFRFPGVVEGVTDESAIALSPDGYLVAVAGSAGKLVLHKTDTGNPQRQLWWRKRPDGSSPAIGALAFLADGKTLVVGCADGIRLYDVETGRERGWVNTHSLRSLAVSGDGAFLAATAERGSAVYLWPVASLQPK